MRALRKEATTWSRVTSTNSYRMLTAEKLQTDSRLAAGQLQDTGLGTEDKEVQMTNCREQHRPTATVVKRGQHKFPLKTT